MSVIWLILKIVAFLFLTLLGLFILVLIGVIFLPITYDLEYYKNQTFHCILNVKAFKLIKIFYKLTDEGSIFTVRLIGKNLLQKHEINEESTDHVKSTDDVKHSEHVILKSAQVVDKQSHLQGVKVDSKKISKQKQVYDKDKSKKNEEDEKTSKLNFARNIKNLWQDANRKIFVQAVYKLLKCWLKAIKPKAFFFHLVIGREDPAETGQLIAKLTLLYPLYYQYGMVSGNYTEAGLWGEARIRGKFAIKSLIKPLIIFLYQKRVREYIYRMLELRKDD